MLTLRQKNRIIHRILSGHIRCSVKSAVYYVIPPTSDISYEAEEIYADTIYNNRYDDFLSASDIARSLHISGVWQYDSENNLKEIEKVMEDIKVDMFKNFLNKDALDKLEKRLKATSDRHMEMLKRKHSLDHLGIEAYAERCRQEHIYIHTICDKTFTPIWPCIEKCDIDLLHAIYHFLMSNQIEPSQYREIARTEPWRGMWAIKGNELFQTKILTDEQRNLALYTRMYENAAKNPNVPPDDILNHDDAFDGWLIHERRASEKEQMKAFVEDSKNITDKHSNAQEIFIVANSEEERQTIEDLNDHEANMVKKQRAAIIKNSQGPIKDTSLPDQRMRQQQEALQKFKDTVKGNK